MPRNQLTEAQQNFCKYYVDIGIGAKAYVKAYPKAEKWKRNTLDCEVSRMLKNPKINQRINELNDAKTSALMQSTKLNQRKLLESALSILEDCQHTPSQYANAINVLKLLYTQQGMMPNASTQVNIQNNIQNNIVVGEVTDYLDL